MRIDRYILALAALVTFAIPQVASAHTQLVASTPAANATVSRPTRIELRFNEAVIGSTASAELVMAGMPGMPC